MDYERIEKQKSKDLHFMFQRDNLMTSLAYFYNLVIDENKRHIRINGKVYSINTDKIKNSASYEITGFSSKLLDLLETDSAFINTLKPFIMREVYHTNDELIADNYENYKNFYESVKTLLVVHK